MPKLLQDTKEELKEIVQEGQMVVRRALQVATGALDIATRLIAIFVIMSLTSWLSSWGVPRKVSDTIQDLPFEEMELCSSRTSKVLPP